VEVCADLHLRPYYGDEDDTDGLYHSVAKRGTTAFHAYATLYARVKNKRYTLAVRRLKDGDTASSVLAIIRWGEAIQQELSEGWSRVIQHDLTGNSTVTAGPSIFPSTSTVRT